MNCEWVFEIEFWTFPRQTELIWTLCCIWSQLPWIIHKFLYCIVADCFYGNGRGYRGNTNTTKWGKSCLSWDTHRPDKSKLNESIYDEIRNSSNFCRNPGGLSSRKPWCYFVDEGTVKWEYCNVPGCPKQRKYTDLLRSF